MLEQDFAQRVRRAEDKLFRVSYAILGNTADCEDALQEALLKAWRKIDSLREERYFETWLMRILIHECYALMRKHKAPPVQLPVATENPGLHDALRALDNKFRLPITLYYVEGYSVGEISAMLRVPEGTIKSRLHRGRRALKALLEEVDEI